MFNVNDVLSNIHTGSIAIVSDVLSIRGARNPVYVMEYLEVKDHTTDNGKLEMFEAKEFRMNEPSSRNWVLKGDEEE